MRRTSHHVVIPSGLSAHEEAAFSQRHVQLAAACPNSKTERLIGLKADSRIQKISAYTAHLKVRPFKTSPIDFQQAISRALLASQQFRVIVLGGIKRIREVPIKTCVEDKSNR